jgi:hypothetical protein
MDAELGRPGRQRGRIGLLAGDGSAGHHHLDVGMTEPDGRYGVEQDVEPLPRVDAGRRSDEGHTVGDPEGRPEGPGTRR